MNRSVVIAGVAFLVACGNSDAQPHTETPAPSATPSATASIAPTAIASAPPAATTWTAPTDHGGDAIEANCTEMITALRESAKPGERGIQGAGETMIDAIKAIAPPAGWPNERTEWCRTEMVNGVRAYLEASLDVEAKATLREIARSQVMAYERESLGPKANVTVHQLCPSAKPIPETLEKLAPNYTSKATEWSKDKGWSCLKFEISAPQRFQYEVKTDLTAKSFDAIARRATKGELIELSIHGEHTSEDGIALSDLRTKRTPR